VAEPGHVVAAPHSSLDHLARAARRTRFVGERLDPLDRAAVPRPRERREPRRHRRIEMCSRRSRDPHRK
jgi:hypothetical protein